MNYYFSLEAYIYIIVYFILNDFSFNLPMLFFLTNFLLYLLYNKIDHGFNKFE